MSEIMQQEQEQDVKQLFDNSKYGLTLAEDKLNEIDVEIAKRIKSNLMVTKNMEAGIEDRVQNQVELNENLAMAKKYGLTIAMKVFERDGMEEPEYSKPMPTFKK